MRAGSTPMALNPRAQLSGLPNGNVFGDRDQSIAAGTSMNPLTFPARNLHASCA
jgi:hypothetical protein